MRESCYPMTEQDLERIARAALRELGAGDVPLMVSAMNGGDRWQIIVTGTRPRSLHIRAGIGTSAQFIRDQIFEQFERR
jgi:hypothetical protein